jgi:hypothetical protein
MIVIATRSHLYISRVWREIRLRKIYLGGELLIIIIFCQVQFVQCLTLQKQFLCAICEQVEIKEKHFKDKEMKECNQSLPSLKKLELA